MYRLSTLGMSLIRDGFSDSSRQSWEVGCLPSALQFVQLGRQQQLELDSRHSFTCTSLRLSKLKQMERFHIKLSLSLMSHAEQDTSRKQEFRSPVLTVLFGPLSHSPVLLFLCLGSTMPVVGVASKLRQPSTVGTKPVHTALPIPNAVRAATSQGYMARQQELKAGEGTPGLSCQLSIKSEYQQARTPEGKSRAETEESKICKVSGDEHTLAVCFSVACQQCGGAPQVSGMKESTLSLAVSVMLSFPSWLKQVSSTKNASSTRDESCMLRWDDVAGVWSSVKGGN
ncbi:hypothetical protein PAMA_013028 [Pampus argenteus]